MDMDTNVFSLMEFTDLGYHFLFVVCKSSVLSRQRCLFLYFCLLIATNYYSKWVVVNFVGKTSTLIKKGFSGLLIFEQSDRFVMTIMVIGGHYSLTRRR